MTLVCLLTVLCRTQAAVDQVESACASGEDITATKARVVPSYGDAEYWEARYRGKEDVFDWYASYEVREPRAAVHSCHVLFCRHCCFGGHRS